MTELNRGYHADLEIRSDGTGRTVHGIVVPYGQVARVRDPGGPAYDESFQKGAFAKNLAERRSPVKLLSQHDPVNPIGVAVEMHERDDGLYGAFKLSNTSHANDQLELVRDGVLDAFSVGFTGVKSMKRGNVTVRTEAMVREASLVTFPAYAGALVAGLRSLDDPDLRAACDALQAAGWDVESIVQAVERGDLSLLTSLAHRLDADAAGAGTPGEGAVADEPLAEHSAILRHPATQKAFRACGTAPQTKE